MTVPGLQIIMISRNYFKIIINAVTVVFVVLMLAFASVIYLPRIVGITPMNVLSGSMEPTYPVGSIIYVDNGVASEEIKTNDVITFSENNVIVTHRVKEITSDGNYITKGDANDIQDGGSVSYENVIGKPIFCIPYLGYIASFIASKNGVILLIGVIIVLMLMTYMVDTQGLLGKEQRYGEDY